MLQDCSLLLLSLLLFDHEVNFRQYGMNDDNNDVEFHVALCHDVLFEVLQRGDRRQLVKLQQIGRRLYRMIETYFGVKPFLRLNFRLASGFRLFSFIYFYHFNLKMPKKLNIFQF